MLVFVIKNIRIKKNMSLYELSQRTDISRTYLRELENNTKINPSVRILEDIADALEVNIKDLFYTTLEINKLKKKLYKKIDKYGINSKEAMELSEVIDLLVNIEMQKD